MEERREEAVGCFRGTRDNPTTSFTKGSGGEHIIDDKKAELSFCISVHKICDKLLNVINIKIRTEQLRGMVENGYIDCIQASEACRNAH